MAVLFRLLIAMACLLALPTQAAEGRRVALVVGIGGYQYAPHLTNPANDAKAMSRKLTELGFAVEERIDPDFRSLAKALREFGIRAQTADAAVVFFAGHGMQVDGENFLVPADARLERQRDLVYEAMPLSLMLGEAAQAKHIAVVILDACRNNPFVARLNQTAATRGMGISQGLARVDTPPQDTLVAMATKADAVAEDGEGEHSPYTAALLEELSKQGVELGMFFREVRDAVLKATSGRQEPYTYGSLGADAFFFHPVPPNHPPQVAVLPPLELPTTAGATRLPITGISDPDNDPLSARITGLPVGGTVKLGSRILLIGDTLTAEQLAQVTFTPDGKHVGYAGALTFNVEDGHGASVPDTLFLKIVQINRPPLLEAPKRLVAVANPLGLGVPRDPDGDPVKVTVTAVPTQGVVRLNGGAVKAGDALDANALPSLSFDPGRGEPGPAGRFAVVADDGKGGRTEAGIDIEIGSSRALVAQPKPADPQLASVAPIEGMPAGPVAVPRPAPQPQSPPPAQPEHQQKPVSRQLAAVAPAPPPPATSGAKPLPSAGETVKDCADCPDLVAIRPGSFTMGSAKGDASERPPHKVTLAKGFLLGRTEVTIGQFNACVAAHVCRKMEEVADDPGLPAYNLSWKDAADYVGWLAKTTGKPYRLPTEAEWEYAARAGTTSAYWWGETARAENAECKDCGGIVDERKPAPAGSLAANAWGLSGMNGGVAEWVADCWFPSHAGAPADGKARDKPHCTRRVLRGGSWLNDHTYVTSSSRLDYDANVRYPANGFRVARDTQ
jgi:formylglycine-generating enzyme required for sulfatase activity